MERVLEPIWSQVERQNLHCKMPDALFYGYIISHIAKHLKFGGCGVRAVMDLWVLNHKLPHDKGAREAVLAEMELLTLAQALEGLAEVWFSGAEADERSETLEQYVLTGGVYGTFENKVAAQQSRKKNKVAYFFSRLFLPYSQMKYKYPKLQKCPILYPFYVVKRWCLLLKKDTKERAVREWNETAKGDKEAQDRVAKLLKDLDI